MKTDINHNTRNSAITEDEIDLYQLFFVLRKRVKLIASIFILAIILALAISFFILPLVAPKYRILTTITPGWYDKNRGGNNMYIDNPANIRSTIEEGIFNERIIETLGLPKDTYMNNLKFKTFDKKQAPELIHVYYDTKDTKTGMAIVGELLNNIKNTYKERVDSKFSAIDNAVKIKRNEIKNTENQKVMTALRKEFIVNEKARIIIQKERVQNAKQKIARSMDFENTKSSLIKGTEKRLSSQVKKIYENSDLLFSQRNSILTSDVKSDPTSALLYSTTIQQNLAYANQLSTQLESQQLKVENSFINMEQFKIQLTDKDAEISELEVQIKDKDIELKREDAKLKDLDTQIEQKLLEIEQLNLDKNSVEGIRILSQPHIIRKNFNKAIVIIITGIISLFIGIFLSFYLEWDERYKEEHRI